MKSVGALQAKNISKLGRKLVAATNHDMRTITAQIAYEPESDHFIWLLLPYPYQKWPFSVYSITRADIIDMVLLPNEGY